MISGTAIYMGWDDVIRNCQVVVAAIRACSRKVERIVAVSRGGLVPAAIIANALDIRDVRCVAVSSYSSDGTKIAMPEIDWDATSNSIPDGLETLFIDDIVDSGDTLKVISAGFKKSLHAALVVRYNTRNVPDLFGSMIEHNHWIQFPWESTKT